MQDENTRPCSAQDQQPEELPKRRRSSKKQKKAKSLENEIGFSKKCYYELLEIELTASPKQIEKAYKKAALKWHPDKNIGCDTTELFQLVQQAFRCLSDPQEKAWYDAHREQILKDPDALKAENEKICSYLTKGKLEPYFKHCIFEGFEPKLPRTDFFSVYAELFDRLAKEEQEAATENDTKIAEKGLPHFGDAQSAREQVDSFYACWQQFTTGKLFHYVELYDMWTAPNRRIKKLIEVENRQARTKERNSFVTRVKELVEHVRLLDPRLKDCLTIEKGHDVDVKFTLSPNRNNMKDQNSDFSTKKPRINSSFETLVLATSSLDQKLRPAGFRANGCYRQIKNSSLLAKIKDRCTLRRQNPKLAVCITMYNEDEKELQNTLRGCLLNYNKLRVDPGTKFTKDDFLVTVICDGYERIPNSLKKLARQKGFLDEEMLFQRGFMEVNENQQFFMKNIDDIMIKELPKEEIPSNLLHCFQVTTSDFGLESELLKGRRINFMFCIKQRNDGKINSHKWFFQAMCKFLKPEYTLMLDIGARPDQNAIQKLFNFMREHPQAGGVCGEIEIEIQPGSTAFQFMVQAAQFYEFKLSHTPDKASESLFGFTSVLPGAYSMFRWKAIKGSPLDKFFKNVTSYTQPTCAEANEYLAEDRIMCLQIYIKKDTAYTVQYIPDAKAFVDGPTSLNMLMKQRRRWMNGALFGTFKVIWNSLNMVSCRRNDHNKFRQMSMAWFLVYLTSMYLLQFVAVGAMFVTLMVFYDEFFKAIFVENNSDSGMRDFYESGILSKILFSAYLCMLGLTVIVSIDTPIDKAIGYYRIVAVVMGILILTSIGAISVLLIQKGFHPNVKICLEDTNNPDGPCWWSDYYDEDGNEVKYFSLMSLAVAIAMTMFILPMFMRPFDFLANMKKYVVGFVSYMLMMPIFTNIFQIYSMCNLHDVSWGNRPKSTGQEAFSASARAQAAAAQEYKLFRTKFVLVWILVNSVFYVVIDQTVAAENSDQEVGQLKDKDSGYLTILTIILTAMVGFRVFFASIYIGMWKCRYNCSRKYRIKPFKIEETETAAADQEQYPAKKSKYDEESSDEEMYGRAIQAMQETGDTRSRISVSPIISPDGTQAGSSNDYVGTQTVVQTESDCKEDDYAFKDLCDAEIEEAEDRIYNEYRRRVDHGEKNMSENQLQDLAGDISLEELEQNIVTSARAGHSRRSFKKTKTVNQSLDFPALLSLQDSQQQIQQDSFASECVQTDMNSSHTVANRERKDSVTKKGVLKKMMTTIQRLTSGGSQTDTQTEIDLELQSCAPSESNPESVSQAEARPDVLVLNFKQKSETKHQETQRLPTIMITDQDDCESPKKLIKLNTMQVVTEDSVLDSSRRLVQSPLQEE